MKAARIFGPNEMRYVDMDTPPYGDDEVLIRVKRAGVCGTDLAIRNRQEGKPSRGYE